MAGGYDALRAILSDRTVAFHPQMARALGGINEALLFQQLAYWSGKGDDPDWIYKTQVELEEETALSEYQQHRARQSLKRLGVIREERRGVPAKLYYQVVWEAMFALLDARFQDPRNQGAGKLDPSSRETRNLDSGSQGNQIPGSSASITESTSETTSQKDGQADEFVPAPDDPERVAAAIAQVAAELRDDAPPGASARRAWESYVAAGVGFGVWLGHVDAAKRAALRAWSSGSESRMPAFWRALEGRLGRGERRSA